MEPAEFRRLGHELIDWLAEYREGVADLPVMSRVRPGDVAARLPGEPPLRGDGLGDVVDDLNSTVLPGITHWNHPGFFAYFPSNTDLASVLADLVSAGLGAQGMSWQTSPAATEVEDVVMDWLRQMVGLPGSFSGVIHDIGQHRDVLRAALRPRAHHAGSPRTRAGCRRRPRRSSSTPPTRPTARSRRPPCWRASAPTTCACSPRTTTHAMRAGPARCGRRAKTVRPAACPAPWWRPSAPRPPPPSTRCGRWPRWPGAKDSWLHVDAALAGSAMVCPECRWMWDGIEAADSLVFNPHKWLGAGFDLSAYYVRDPQHLVRVMSTDPSYLRTAQDG